MSFRINTKYNGPGVYAIIDIRNFKAYIGSSCRILNRAKQHLNLLKTGKHNTELLQNDYNNKCNFVFVVLEKCNNISDRKLLFKEYCYMYSIMNEGFTLYNKIGGTKEQLTDMIVQNSIIENCCYIPYFFKKRFRDYLGLKRSHKTSE